MARGSLETLSQIVGMQRQDSPPLITNVSLKSCLGACDWAVRQMITERSHRTQEDRARINDQNTVASHAEEVND